MIPDKVKFTGLEIDPREILSPRKVLDGTYPSDWTRYQFELPHETFQGVRNLDRWLETAIHGRWGSYMVFASDALRFVVVFESVSDAVMFKLMDGETAWLSSDELRVI